MVAPLSEKQLSNDRVLHLGLNRESAAEVSALRRRGVDVT